MKLTRENLLDLVLTLAAAAFFALASEVALAFPEMIRQSYQSCSSCHLSSAGGGATTAYGRMAGEDMASFAPENSGQLLLGAVAPPEHLVVGGDYRWIRIDAPGFRKAFVMQNDAELGLKLSSEVWIDASFGRYGEAPKPESRRSYVLWTPADAVSVRAGHFMPAYGIMLPDHTAATRARLGFGEGQEAYAGELVLRGSLGEMFLTETVADGSSLTLGKDPNYQTSAQRPAYLARGSAFVGKAAVLGASYRLEADETGPGAETFGPFVLWGVTKELYLLSEWDRKSDKSDHVDVSWTELGYELVRGLHVQATHEYDQGNRYGLGLQWFPFPHVETLARAKYQAGVWTTQVLFHLSW